MMRQRGRGRRREQERRGEGRGGRELRTELCSSSCPWSWPHPQHCRKEREFWAVLASGCLLPNVPAAHRGHVVSAAACQRLAMRHHLLRGPPFEKVVFEQVYVLK